MDELPLRRTVYQIAVPLMKLQVAVLFVINRERYFVLMTATAENSVSHKYVDTKRSKTFTALPKLE
jgi:hypothetical protein